MKRRIQFPKFKTESQEADWWASREGREYLKERSAAARRSGIKLGGSPLVAALNKSSVQIAIRIPEHDLDQACKIATSKGIGYQTLLKMLVHEGLERESKRA